MSTSESKVFLAQPKVTTCARLRDAVLALMLLGFRLQMRRGGGSPRIPWH